MTAQGIAVAVIVPLCALYAAWLLMGANARRRIVARLARWPWPAALQRRLARVDAAGHACGCDGCDSNRSGTSAGAHPTRAIVQVRRRRR